VHVTWAIVTGGRLGVGNDPVYSKSTCFDPFPFPDDTGLTPALAERIRNLAEQLDAHRKRQQSAHPELTLTGMYNVLDKLRSGAPLTPKDKAIHEQGLVGVLRTLHDELDAAVLQAYGWADLHLPADTDQLLLRLVALNAKRAAEEAAGTVRWLRPEFQLRGQPGEQAEIETAADTPALPAPAAGVVKRPWPAGLPEQIKAVAETLAAGGPPLTLAELEARFAARGRWRDRLPVILDTLEALGRARRTGAEPQRWQAA